MTVVPERANPEGAPRTRRLPARADKKRVILPQMARASYPVLSLGLPRRVAWRAPMDRKFLHPWQPDSWRTRVAGQQPLYPDAEAAERVLAGIRRLPPLVTWGEVDKLRAQLAEAQRGERFLLQGGDCAESFDDCTADPIANKLKILLQMSLVLVHGLKKRVIRVGRLAGQYAKPRSTDTETRDGLTLPSYRGDLINRAGFSLRDRTPDPQLMLRGYEHAALTLNYVRAMVDGGFAELLHPEYWDLDFVRNSPLEAEYRRIV